MRDDDSRLADIVEAADRILAFTEGREEAAFAADALRIDACFYNIVIIGGAARTLLAGPGRPQDAAIVTAHPEVPWRPWVNMRNMAAHQYFLRDHRIIWNDVRHGRTQQLRDTCRAWLARP